MDIMNNMTVLTSKLTFTLIAISALLVSGSGFMIQDASAFQFDAPEFTAKHINTTATLLTFDQPVNGTIALADWTIKYSSTPTAGYIASNVTISNISNSSQWGVGLTAPSDGDKRISSKGGNGAGQGVAGLGFINSSTFLIFIHEAIPTDATYFINYTNNPASTNNSTTAGGSGAIYSSGGVASAGHGTGGEGSANNKMLKIGSNATALDWISPTVVSAESFKI